MGVPFFEVTCGLGGTFLPPENGWPLCDNPTPQECSNFPTPPDLVEPAWPLKPQLPTGKIYYKCREEGYISNLDESGLVEVECKKQLVGKDSWKTEFVLPNGWNNMKCRSEEYPNFKSKPCICPGDPQVTPELHKRILKLCKENETVAQSQSLAVPLKKRCGVGDLNNITKDALCYCTERSGKAVGKTQYIVSCQYGQYTV